MRRTQTFSAFIVVMLASAAWAAEPAFPVATVTFETVVQEQEFDAVVEAVNQSTVSAQTTGRVVEVNFDVDDYVQKGAVLLRLRSGEQGAGARAAEARAREAKSAFERAKELLEKGLVAKAAYDNAEAELKAANAALEQAREQLGYTVVRAPYSGLVVARHIEVGETAAPGKALMTGVSLDQLRATASVPQVHIAKVRALKRARVILPDESSVDAKSLTISPYADPQTHTFKVRVSLPANVGETYPGMFAKVAFATGETQTLMVPAAAVVRRSEVSAVYVTKPDGSVSFRQVRVGAQRGDKVEVLAGLSEGEQVALDPIKAGIVLKEKRAAGDRS